MFFGFHPSSNEFIIYKLKRGGGWGSVKKCSQRRIVWQLLMIRTSSHSPQKILLFVDRHFTLETPATALPQLTKGKQGYLWFQTIRQSELSSDCNCGRRSANLFSCWHTTKREKNVKLKWLRRRGRLLILCVSPVSQASISTGEPPRSCLKGGPRTCDYFLSIK